jgi:deoxycytidylate deaminase
MQLTWFAGMGTLDTPEGTRIARRGRPTAQRRLAPPEHAERLVHAPEIVIGFVAPSGTDRDLVLGTTRRLLRAVRYDIDVVRLSVLLETRRAARGRPSEATTVRGRAWALQDEGNEFCATAGRKDALAFVAVNEIREARERLHRGRRSEKTSSDVVPGTAYLIWSLKRPDEVETLRAIYRTRFYLVSVYTPESARLNRLIQDEADQRGHVSPTTDDETEARRLVERDEKELKASGDRFGQNVSDTYPLADFFVDATNTTSLDSSLARAVNIIFGDPFATPTRAEFGMFLAHAAALKSAELGRQVGAAALTSSGDVLATGTNEVPRARGGHYWHDDEDDDREFVGGSDTSDRLKARLIAQVLDTIQGTGTAVSKSVREELEAALESTRLADLIEFGRPVHAEMAAISDAARNGSPLNGSILYVTTFPCHLCTRLIIATGIERVEYIYPYPKSLGAELYGRQINTIRSSTADTGRIPFVPFLGVAPRRYAQAFQAPPSRKTASGKAIERHGHSPRLLIEDETGEWDLSTHIPREAHALDLARDWLASEPS